MYRIPYLLSQFLFSDLNPRRPNGPSTPIAASDNLAQIMAKPDEARKSEDWWRERDSNPRCPFRDIHDFQSCSFGHSDTSPNRCIFQLNNNLLCFFLCRFFRFGFSSFTRSFLWLLFSFYFWSYFFFRRFYCGLC